MIVNSITIGLLERGELKTVGVVTLGEDLKSFNSFKCRISKWRKVDGDIILKLKTGKDYPFGHKYIWRSLEEVI